MKLTDIPEISGVYIELTVNYIKEHTQTLDKQEEITIDGIKYKIVQSYTNDDSVEPEDDIRAVSYRDYVLTKTYLLKAVK
ncbi:hypothetical protein OGY83_24155 [Citrobacter sp. Cpo090]|uniref:hypothetical protein n=1 Tax=Citrobacter sp. Cpo090 TaxID=2985139 RepID=UPI002577B0F0|nr:hypothetical protein [Citrobacter sp. Cpo090]MDM2846697.1 hypothetical protein [Citrobacter sp. Cpo090]